MKLTAKIGGILLKRILLILCFASSIAYSKKSDRFNARKNIAEPTFHVSPTGNDMLGNGTLQNPWKSLRFAITKTPADQNYIIQLSEGIFEEDSLDLISKTAQPIKIPSGVSLVGAGQEKTIIKVNLFYDFTTQKATTTYSSNGQTLNLTGPSYHPRPEKFVFELEGSNNRFKDFTLDGNNKLCHGGFRGKTMNDAIFENITYRNFRFSALWIQEVNNVEIHHCNFKNNAFANRLRCFGNIIYHRGTNLSIHDNTIEEPVTEAYGMVAFSQLLTQFWNYVGGSPPAGTPSLTNVKIFNNTIKVPEFGLWNNRTAPAITIEVNGTLMQNWEIYNNYVNNCISLTPTNAERAVRGITTARVHHNYFDLGNQYRYAVELTLPEVEFDHNYINGGYYPVSQWLGKLNRTTYTNNSIHHNVFYAPKGGQPVINYGQMPTGLKIYNNTIYDTKGVSSLIQQRYSDIESISTGLEIKNNIFISVNNGQRGSLFSGMNTVNPDIRNNLFYNITAFGKDSIQINSDRPASTILNLSGNLPTPFFELARNSKAVDVGVILLGITDYYLGIKPDLGAYESNQIAFFDTLKVGDKWQVPLFEKNIKAIKTWQSSNQNIAKVDVNGIVTTLNTGIATISTFDKDGTIIAQRTIVVLAKDIVLSTDFQPINNDVVVYPNPNTGSEIKVKGLLEKSSIELFNSIGISIPILVEKNGEFTMIKPVQYLQNGIFLLRITTKSNTLTKSIIIRN